MSSQRSWSLGLRRMHDLNRALDAKLGWLIYKHHFGLKHSQLNISRGVPYFLLPSSRAAHGYGVASWLPKTFLVLESDI